MSYQPGALQAGERQGDMVPAYGYVIRHVADGNTLFFTGWERPFTIAGMPAVYGAADPQEFTPAQITHGVNQLDAEFARKTVDVTVQVGEKTNDLQNYFTTAAAVKINITILRLNADRLLDLSPAMIWSRDVQVVNSGLIGMVSMSGQTITVQLTPEPHLTNQRVGRFFFQRTCNWQLGGPGCGIDLEAFSHTTTIAAADRQQRIITLDANPIPAVDADFFRNGYFIHTDSGLKFPIQWTDLTGPGGTLRFKLAVWSPRLESLGDEIKAYPGCRHIVSDCTTKFANVANYGGMSRVPDRNPVYHGAI